MAFRTYLDPNGKKYMIDVDLVAGVIPDGENYKVLLKEVTCSVAISPNAAQKSIVEIPYISIPSEVRELLALDLTA